MPYKISLTLFLFSLLFMGKNVFAQMNFQDSSAQVITYWNLGETYEYAISYQKLRYSATDTTSDETITYDVEVSVIDSTEDSYTVRWFYKNIQSNSENPIIQKLTSVANDIAIHIKIDPLGTIIGVENWEEVRDYMAAAFDTLKSQLPDMPEIDRVMEQTKLMYSSKASIEATAIQDVNQFHNFHGGRFVLNQEVTGQLQTPNVYYPDKPFDTHVSVILEELDQENNQYRIRSYNEVDSEQLTETTYEYMTQMFGEANQQMPTREEFMNVTNVVETVARIHDTGWVLESLLWKEVIADEMTNMEIRHIQMKY